MYQCYEAYKADRLREFRVNFMVWMSMIKYKTRVKRFGKDKHERNSRYTNRVLTAASAGIKRASNDRAARVIKRFLFLAKLNSDVIGNTVTTTKLIIKIQ